MLFNSLHFLLFLPVVAFLYFGTGQKLRKWLLLGASYYFYMVFSIPFVLLLIWSTVVAYVIALWIDKSDNQRYRTFLLILNLFSGLGLLFFFKYFNFAAFSLATIFQLHPETWILKQIVLPMGISFFTFQTLSYTIDVYRRQISATGSLLDMALYVTFFPQLVAGPIMRGKTFMPQFSERHSPNSERILSGVLLCVWGLMKKSFVADPIGRYVDTVYGIPNPIWSGMGLDVDPSQFSGLTLLLATYAFAIQIYCDFSAYSNIARGSARILGFRLMVNFDSPYLAESFRKFWQKWHISLSTWLRDYLYISLGGNRRGSFRTYINLMITMVLGGLWHGANWTFFLWGMLHGFYLSIERLFRLSSSKRSESNIFVDALRVFITFNLVCFAWIFFRADTASHAFSIIRGIFSWQAGRELSLIPLVLLMLLFSIELLKKRVNFGEVFLRWPTLSRWACLAILALLAVVFVGSPTPEFIYFQF